MTRHTYAALWAEDGRQPLVGSLTVGMQSLSFEGRGVHEDVDYDEIDSFTVDRSRSGRIGGRTSLVLALAGRQVRLAIAEPGALHELAEKLTAVTA